MITTPILNTKYSVAGEDTNGCTAMQIFSVNILPSPKLNLSGKTELCKGESATLYIWGAASYLWSNNNSTDTSQTFQPSVSTSYTVTGTNTNNCSTSTVVGIMVNECTMIEESEAMIGTTVFPNPVSKKLYIETTDKLNANLFDCHGRLMTTLDIDELRSEIDLSSIPAGVYYLYLYRYNDGVTQKKKVIKIE